MTDGISRAVSRRHDESARDLLERAAADVSSQLGSSDDRLPFAKTVAPSRTDESQVLNALAERLRRMPGPARTPIRFWHYSIQLCAAC
jgi:hypothetical protein